LDLSACELRSRYCCSCYFPADQSADANDPHRNGRAALRNARLRLSAASFCHNLKMQRLVILVVGAISVCTAFCGNATPHLNPLLDRGGEAGAARSGNNGFAATIASKISAPGEAPEGMVWIPGGEFSMGAAVNGEGSHQMPMASNDAEPVHRVRVDGFWMD